MSDQRKVPPQNPVSAMIAAMDGARIPGGCDYCDAYQVIRASQDGPNIHRITVSHDDWCPWLQARQKGPAS